jgi:cytoskeletal protein RodZ
MQGEPGLLRVVPSEEAERQLPGDLPSPGRYVHEQRKRRGMTIEQLAAATKIPRRSLELLEEDRYDELPGPVFVKGFLRCCARALGLADDAVMDLVYAREKAALQARRRPASAPVPEPAPSILPRNAPRVRTRAAQGGRLTARLRARLPSPALLLWLVVAVFVAMVVLAAFNLWSGGPPGGQT